MPRLVGRAADSQIFAALLEGAADRGGALVLHGEAGVGKTALIEHANHTVSGLRVVRAVAVELEMDLALAALHRWSVPRLDRLDRVPEPQRAALETAHGLRVKNMPDRFFAAVAVLCLISAADLSLVCLIQDAECLDRESAQAATGAQR